MDATTTSRNSLLGLIRQLTQETQSFIKQEVELVQTEIAEKIARWSRNGIALAVGASIAYAGLIVFLIGLGLALGFVFEKMDLPSPIAGFIGLAIIGFLAAVIGGGLIGNAVKTFSKETIAPEKTLSTIKNFRGHQPSPGQPSEKTAAPEHKRSSEEIQKEVTATESRMGETLQEIGRRVSPQHMGQQFQHRIQAHPYRWGLVAMSAGLLSGLALMKRRFRKA